jgi:hypothetical protein
MKEAAMNEDDVVWLPVAADETLADRSENSPPGPELRPSATVIDLAAWRSSRARRASSDGRIDGATRRR